MTNRSMKYNKKGEKMFFFNILISLRKCERMLIQRKNDNLARPGTIKTRYN